MKKYNLCLVLLFSMIFALISFEETEASAAGSNRKKPQNGIPVLTNKGKSAGWVTVQ